MNQFFSIMCSDGVMEVVFGCDKVLFLLQRCQIQVKTILDISLLELFLWMNGKNL